MTNAVILLEQAASEIKNNNGTPSTELAVNLVIAAQRALAQATGVDEIKDIRDKLNGVEIYLKRQRAELVNSNLVVAQRMRTERELGKMIPDRFPHGGDRKSSSTNSNLKSYGISPFMSSRWQRMAAIDADDFEEWVQDNLESDELTTALLLRMIANFHVSDDSYEWNTPKEYIEAARRVMGSIDTDPATNDEAQKLIKADHYYTVEDDGLSQLWYGNVWLNPPYNMPYVEQFTDRAISDYQSGQISAAIVLVNNATDTGWFHRLLDYPVCFTKGRIQFWQGDQTLQTRQGQSIFYLGRDIDAFNREFSKFGAVMIRYDDK